MKVRPCWQATDESEQDRLLQVDGNARKSCDVSLPKMIRKTKEASQNGKAPFRVRSGDAGGPISTVNTGLAGYSQLFALGGSLRALKGLAPVTITFSVPSLRETTPVAKTNGSLSTCLSF